MIIHGAYNILYYYAVIKWCYFKRNDIMQATIRVIGAREIPALRVRRGRRRVACRPHSSGSSGAYNTRTHTSSNVMERVIIYIYIYMGTHHSIILLLLSYAHVHDSGTYIPYIIFCMGPAGANADPVPLTM